MNHKTQDYSLMPAKPNLSRTKRFGARKIIANPPDPCNPRSIPPHNYKLFIQNKPNSPNTKMNVTSVTTREYEENRPSSPPKTNPIQTQFKPSQTQLAQMPKMNVTLYLTNPYENQQFCPRTPIKPKSNPIYNIQSTIYNRIIPSTHSYQSYLAL